MTRRQLFAPALGALAAACSPLRLLNDLGPRDRGVRRVAYGEAYGPDPRQRFDVFAPSDARDLPVLVFFYGGNWDSGDRTLYGWAAQALAARGFVVAAPDYRLVPEVRFPAFVEDAAAATARVGEVAGVYGGDSARLGVLGHSAGAWLALMIALDRRYMAATGASDLFRAAAGRSGPYDFVPFDVPASINAFGQAPDATLTQPVTFVRPDAPPLWLGHGTGDTVVRPRNSVELDRLERAAGGRSILRLYDGLNHADTIAAYSPLFRRKAPVLADVTGFFRQALGQPA
jgi:acetyl esterase/lipase